MQRKLALRLGLPLLLCIGITAYFAFENRTQEALTLHGNVDVREVSCAFRVDGRIAHVLVEEGSRVRAGEPLARIDDDVLRGELARAEANLAAQNAQLARLKKGYRTEEIAQAESAVAAAAAIADNAKINLDRVTAMRGVNAISQKELDNARASAREADAKLLSAQDNLDMLTTGYRVEDVHAQEAQVADAKAALTLAQIRVADAVLLAPQDGVVLTRAREAGAVVQAGETVYTLALTDPTWVRAYVDEPNLARIIPGMAVDVHVDAFPGKPIPGIVGFISPSAEFTPKTVETQEVRTNLMYRVRIRVADPDGIMRQGMPVVVAVPTGNGAPARQEGNRASAAGAARTP